MITDHEIELVSQVCLECSEKFYTRRGAARELCSHCEKTTGKLQ